MPICMLIRSIRSMHKPGPAQIYYLNTTAYIYAKVVVSLHRCVCISTSALTELKITINANVMLSLTCAHCLKAKLLTLPRANFKFQIYL